MNSAYPQGQYPNYPQGGYPQGGYPQGGYPQGGYPQGGYPQGGYPQGGYPQGGHPQGGYPQGGYPQGGYPQGGYPQGGYPVTDYQQPTPAGYAAPGTLGEDGGTSAFDFTDMSIRKAFISKVYSILMVQLLVTMGFIALFVFHQPTKMWVQRNNYLLIIALVVVIATLIVLSCCNNLRRQFPLNFILLAVFTIAESFLLGVTASLYEANEVMMAIGITAAVCLGLTIFALQTKWDFTVMGGFLVCAVMVLLVFGIIALFIQANNIVRLVYAALGALIFSLFLIYDTQLLLGGKHKYSISPEEYVFAALSLYVDIINIFIYILSIIGLLRD